MVKGGLWCHIIVLNIHAPTEDKIVGVKDGFYNELEHEFDKFPKYHNKILLGELQYQNRQGRHF
jgi:hypothetical protein